MAENIVIRGTVYPDVEYMSMMNENDEVVEFYPDAVRYNTAQNLTEAQKAQARINIDAIKGSDLTLAFHSDGLLYVFVNGSPVGEGIDVAAGGDVIGYVDADNTIVLRGNVPDGEYIVKYELDNETIEIGELVIGEVVTIYTITNNLTSCTNSNTAITIEEGSSYSATIMANSGYELKTVTVTMGGAAVSVSGGVINIASVTGNIVITAVAEEAVAAEPTNFAEPNTTNTSDWSIWCNNARFGSDGSYRSNSGTVVTNYVPIQVGDTLYFEGLNVATTGTSMTNGLAFYDGEKDIIAPSYLYWFVDNGYLTVDVTDGAYTIEILDAFSSYVNGTYGGKGSETAFARIAGALTGTVDDVVIKVKRNGEWL